MHVALAAPGLDPALLLTTRVGVLTIILGLSVYLLEQGQPLTRSGLCDRALDTRRHRYRA